MGAMPRCVAIATRASLGEIATPVSLTGALVWDSMTWSPMPAPTKPNRERLLAELLEERFDAHELMTIAREIDLALYNALHGRDIGLSELATELVRKAFNHGLIDDEFFAILHRERPRLRQRIGEVAALWHEERKRQSARDSVPAEHIEMVDIPAGSFIMGSPDSDDMAEGDEKPAHTVLISAFRCMVTPVTRAQWVAVMGVPHNWYPPGPADERPVTNISWFGAIRFCNALSQKMAIEPCYRIDGDQVAWVSSEGYRLPTEAEWEYACRAGTKTRWWFGNDESELANYSWYDENSGGEPQPRGGKPANPWGLYDMHGNILEWCWDWYAPYPSEEQTNPRGPTDADAPIVEGLNEKARLLRGGSYWFRAVHLRCADRFGYWQSYQSRSSGLRVVCGANYCP